MHVVGLCSYYFWWGVDEWMGGCVGVINPIQYLFRLLHLFYVFKNTVSRT